MSTQKNRHTRRQIKYSDPGKILDLIVSLNDETCGLLQVKINTYLAEECESELALLIIVNVDRMEACIDAVGATPLPRKRKISMPQRLIDILNSVTDVMEPFEAFAQDFRSIVEPYIMKDSQKKRFSMFAIRDKTFSVIACLLAPKIQEEHVTVYVNECFLFAWPTFKKAILLEHESTLKTKCQQLLRVTRRLFSQVASMDTLLNIAMEQAKQLTRAEHCRVMLIDPHKMELVDSKSERAGELSRFPLNKGIVGQVITTGRLVNAKVAKDHPAFDPEIDSRPEIDCKMILCFPIREQSGIIGVGQLMNKEGDPYFDGMDEELALAFSIYCGVCIIHSMVYQKIQEANIRNTLANELVMYHMKVSDAEVSRMVECAGFHGHPYLHSLHFNIRMLPLRELPCYALRMFHDLGFHKKFDIKTEKLVRFILHVKKGYRDVPYHNWLHAFSVAQWAYAAMIKFRLISEGYLTDLQALMYLVAGLVHDLDHRGTTNSFHMQGQTTLAALYSSEGSVMERHHLAQAMCILNTEGCDILESLPRRDYDRALLLLRDYILATDLANYFKNLNDYKAIALDFHPGNRVHASALQALLMNAADLSDQLMDWGSIKKTAAAVLTEFFKQGDVEKSRGDLPSAIMDREKCIIPELEMQFLETTCIPLFEILSVILPRAQPCIKILENHRERWDHALPIFKEVPVSAGLSILLSPELDNLIEVSFKERERQRIEDEAAAAAAAAATAAELE